MINKTNHMKYDNAWYSGNPEELYKDIKKAVENSPRMKHYVSSAVLPHAGHLFSARGIAHFFKNCNPETKHIVIMAPSHREYLSPDTIIYSTFSHHETPSGNIPGFRMKNLEKSNLSVENNTAVENEHAIEMFLPFIRSIFNEKVSVTSILIPGITDLNSLEKLSEIITDSTPPNTAYIASSDFTHYGARFGYTPFGTSNISEISRKTKNLDIKYAQYMAKGKTEKAFALTKHEKPTICGIFPAVILSEIMRMENKTGTVADYYTSNDIGQKAFDFVAYAAILFHEKQEEKK